MEAQIRSSPDALREYVETFSRTFGAQIAKRRIYCLTPFPDSTLMWSHYAANHSGICLEFDVDNPLFRNARPVRYRSTYPEWALHDIEENILELVLTKSMDWAYEREFRLIASQLTGPLKLHGDFLLLPSGALTCVIIGCEADDKAVASIIKIVREHSESLPIKRAVRAPDRYKLIIERAE